MFSIPISTRTYGNKRQQHKEFNWRHCSFPLVEQAIVKPIIEDYWETNGWIGGDLFTERRQIKFPVISNCINCFHKKVETLAVMSALHPTKMQWAANQELKGKGTWLDSRIPYQHIIDNNKEVAKEVFYEITVLEHSCDSGGCTA